MTTTSTPLPGLIPDPNHMVALALSGVLADAQAGEILHAAFRPHETAPDRCPWDNWKPGRDMP